MGAVEVAQKKEHPKLTAKDVRRILREHFASDAHVVLEEVSDAAGHDRCRSADMLVMGLWPSRGLLLEGVEIKVSRADWLSELKDPEKSDVFARYCDRWWLVTSNPDIVMEGELPTNWGHKSIVGGHVRVIKPAPALTPAPLSRDLLAAMLKRATRASDTVLQEAVDAQIQTRLEEKERMIGYQARVAQGTLDTLRRQIHAFESMSGLSVSYPDPKRLELMRGMLGLAEMHMPDVQRLIGALGNVAEAAEYIKFGVSKLREQQIPALESLKSSPLVVVDNPPTSLVDFSEVCYGGAAPVGHGHTFVLGHRDLTQDKARCTRGFFRFWEPPMVGVSHTRGTKRRPSVRKAGEVPTPNYRLEAVYAQKTLEDVKIVFVETPHDKPEWDLIAILPEGWRPKFEYAKRLEVTVTVDDRPHMLWAVPTTPEIPLNHLGEWVMSGTYPEAEAQ